MFWELSMTLVCCCYDAVTGFYHVAVGLNVFWGLVGHYYVVDNMF